MERSDQPRPAAELAQDATRSETQSQMSTTHPGPTASVDDCSKAVNQVFALFQSHWPRKFDSIWKAGGKNAVAQSKRAWLRAFQRCGWLKPETLEAGLERVLLQEWPPDNPGEFLQLCHRTPEMVGAPDATAAFHEACRGAHPGNVRRHSWSNKAVYWAAVRTGLQALMERPNKNEKRFHEKYQEALDHFETLDDPPSAELPHRPPEPGPEADEAARKTLAELRKMVGGRA